MQAATFAECTTQVQLFKRLCQAYDEGMFADHELIFSDRTSKTADQLKDEISQRVDYLVAEFHEAASRPAAP
jgi:hypothetical protein